MSDRIYVTAAQVRAARLIVARDRARGLASDAAVVAIARAAKVASAVPRRRAG